MIRSFKIRVYPTKEQEQLMWKHVGASRWLCNFMLDEQKRRYENGEKHMSAFDMHKYITVLKKMPEYAWLGEIGIRTLQIVCADLDSAYKNFFSKSGGFPKYKSRKRSKLGFPLANNVGHVWFEESVVHLPKIGKVKYKTDHDIPLGRSQKFSNPRISYVLGKWILSAGMECENQAPVLTDKPMGIDLGVKDLAVVEFDGEMLQFHNINKSKKMRQLSKKLTHLQRSVSRKYEANKQGSRYIKTNNIAKQENEIRKIHARMANIRNNYIHQTTHTLVSKLPNRVVMEDLNVAGMMKNKHLSKAIGEQNFHEFIRQMQYKCEWNGIEFVQVGRFYPSSKACSKCGTIKTDLKLSDRTYRCPCCGLVIDRDYNAAINLSRYVA